MFSYLPASLARARHPGYSSGMPMSVKQWPDPHDIWWVARHEDDAPWMEFSTIPICPVCGETLRTVVSSKQRTNGLALGE